MGLFDGINTASSTKGGVYLKADALYQVLITKCEMIKTRKLIAGVPIEAFICEFTVLASNHPDIAVGLKASWYNGADKEPFLGNQADFLRATLAALGQQKHAAQVTPEQIVPTPELQHQVSTTPMLEGVQMAVQTVGTTTKANKPFTIHRWEPAKTLLAIPEQKAA
jgi:hypothetical protein